MKIKAYLIKHPDDSVARKRPTILYLHVTLFPVVLFCLFMADFVTYLLSRRMAKTNADMLIYLVDCVFHFPPLWLVVFVLIRQMQATWVTVCRLPMSSTRSLAATSLCSPTAGKDLYFIQDIIIGMIAWHRHEESCTQDYLFEIYYVNQ